ncbi:MAG: TIGR04141 family sporadically distributed protein [Kofleriaceae bacterium]
MNIHLAKTDVKDPRDLLRRPESALEIEVAPGITGHFVLPPPATTKPTWRRFFDGTKAAPKLKDLGSTSVGAALVLRTAKRCFALTWGHSGRAQIDATRLEDRFGLKTTLSAIPADQVKSIEHKSFDALTRNTVSQGSRSGEVFDYGIDIERDLVRAVLGVPTDATLGKRLHGKDALTATVALAIGDLPQKLKLYLGVYASDKYKTAFEWIDHLAEERNKGVISRLEATLVSKIRVADFDRIWLTPAEVLPWQQVGKFSYAGDRNRAEFDELNIDEWHSTVRKASALAIDGLKSRHVRWHDATSEEVRDQWSVYKTLHAEIEDGGHTYLLSEGKWYRINTDFVSRTNKAIDALVVPTTLPPYRKTAKLGTPHKGEGAYNTEVHQANAKKYAHLDAKNISLGGGPSRIEACDLFDTDRVFTHVKRYNSAKDMSHLFAQGMNSAQALLNSDEFRQKLVDKLPPSHKRFIPLKPPIQGSNFGVRFVIIREPSKTGQSVTQRLPFFSRLSLSRAASVMQASGMRVEVMHVDSK